MDNYLAISAVGQDRPGIVNELSRAILEYGCNIVDSRMTVLGGEFAIILMVSGHWNQIAKLESALPKFAANLGLTLNYKRTSARKAQPDLIPYDIDVVAIDHPGIVHQLTNFFSSRHINIEDLSTSSYYAAHTGAKMFTLTMIVGIPSSMSIADIRELFFTFCDDLNLDATMQPHKA